MEVMMRMEEAGIMEISMVNNRSEMQRGEINSTEMEEHFKGNTS